MFPWVKAGSGPVGPPKVCSGRDDPRRRIPKAGVGWGCPGAGVSPLPVFREQGKFLFLLNWSQSKTSLRFIAERCDPLTEGIAREVRVGMKRSLILILSLCYT